MVRDPSRRHLLQNAAVFIPLSLLPSPLPTPSQLYGAEGSLCKATGSRPAPYLLPRPVRIRLPRERVERHSQQHIKGIQSAALLEKPTAHVPQFLPTSTPGGTQSIPQGPQNLSPFLTEREPDTLKPRVWFSLTQDVNKFPLTGMNILWN